MTETMIDREEWLASAETCYRIAARAEIEGDPERAVRWRRSGDEAAENARRISEGRTDLIP